MKRRDIINKLKAAGFDLVEGAKHTKVLKAGVRVSVISRQREIDEQIVRAIERQTGVNLK